MKRTLSNNLQTKELIKFIQEYERLANKCDFNLLIPFIDEYAVYWFSNGTYEGIDAIRKAFEETWSNIQKEKYTITNVQWLLATDNEAVCIYDFHSDGIVKGKRQKYNGRGTNLFKKVDGKWKIIHEHLSKSV